MEITYEMVLNFIKEGLLDEELVDLWNEYCQIDNYIFDFSDPEYFFNDNFENPYDACRAMQFGDVSWNDCYIAFNGYGNLQTFQYFDEYGNYNDLAKWLFPHWQDHFKYEVIVGYNS